MDINEDLVIKNIKNNKALTCLLKHERNKDIINTKGTYYQYVRSLSKYKKLNGLLDRLRKTFYPDFDLYQLTKNNKKTKKKKKIQNNGIYGKDRGKMIHKEIEDFITLDKKNFLKFHPTVHAFTKKIFKQLELMKWQPVKSEFDVFDENLGIGTSIDMICVNHEGKIVLIELKFGYRDNYDDYDNLMLHSLKNLTNSPHNQANLQLITSAIFIIKNHHISLNDLLLYVIKVDEDRIYPYQILNDYVKLKMHNIYNDLLMFK